MRIPLPNIIQNKSEILAHTFPFQIGSQTLELMHASVFFSMLSDEASGQRVRQPNAIPEIDNKLLSYGIEKHVIDTGWEYLGKYINLFEKHVTQTVLFSLRSHWDWYVRNLGKFVISSLMIENRSSISKTILKDMESIGFKDIPTQISILKKSTSIELEISDIVMSSVYEMSLVRNLGLHNRWEVDDYYLAKTKSIGWSSRDIRTFSVIELQEWHAALISLINKTSIQTAKRFKDSPPFNINDP